MKLDRSELILKALATQYLHNAVSNLHLSLRHAAAFERSNTEGQRSVHEQHAAYHQFMALEADEIARMSGIDSDEMNKFMHTFFATNIDWS